MEAVALGTLVVDFIGLVFVGNLIGDVDVAEHVESVDVANLETLEVLGHHEGLGKAAVVVAAEVDRLSVLANVDTSFLAAIRVFIGTDHVEVAEFARDSRGEELVVQGRLIVFSTLLVEGILERALETSKLRRLVRDHVVGTAGDGKTKNVIVAAVEGVGHGVNDVIRTGGGSHAAHATHGDRTKVTRERERSFAVEERVLRLESTRIGLEAVFEIEANLHAVAELFRALDAEAVARIDAAIKAERVSSFGRRITVGLIFVRVHQTGVDHTVHRDIGRKSGTGKRAENGDSCERFLKHNH